MTTGQLERILCTSVCQPVATPSSPSSNLNRPEIEHSQDKIRPPSSHLLAMIYRSRDPSPLPSNGVCDIRSEAKYTEVSIGAILAHLFGRGRGRKRKALHSREAWRAGMTRQRQAGRSSIISELSTRSQMIPIRAITLHCGEMCYGRMLLPDAAVWSC